MSDAYENRFPEFPNLPEDEIVLLARLPWWAHKFVQAGVTVFYVNHAIQMAGEVARFPNDNLGASLADVEAQLPLSPLGAADNSNWIIQRKNSTMASRYYILHHNPDVTDKCPPSSSYSSLECIADNHCLTTMHNTNTNPPTCCPASVCGS